MKVLQLLHNKLFYFEITPSFIIQLSIIATETSSILLSLSCDSVFLQFIVLKASHKPSPISQSCPVPNVIPLDGPRSQPQYEHSNVKEHVIPNSLQMATRAVVSRGFRTDQWQKCLTKYGQ